MADALDPNLLNDLIKAALAAGADAAEAVASRRQSLSVGVRNGALDEVERSESADLGLRVFVGQRQATVSAADASAVRSVSSRVSRSGQGALARRSGSARRA